MHVCRQPVLQATGSIGKSVLVQTPFETSLGPIQGPLRTHSEFVHCSFRFRIHSYPFKIHSGHIQNVFRTHAWFNQDSLWTHPEFIRNSCRTHSELNETSSRTLSASIQNSYRIRSEPMQNSSRMHTELAHNSTRTLSESIENSFRTHFIQSSCNSFRTPLNFSITHSESIQEPIKSHLELKELFQSSTGLIPDYLKQTENPVPSTRRCRETNWYR